ncbi:hypothetical protein HU200_021104 [Digitaria exilis]|uniref:Uncharacterized protein n=1 Tax=Digitaria exilis TaxID=1010633 RepID=A0A835KFG5_9POAL|nr:hypothetical protein HU200_021104 [Digitaria exilis]CAB3472691.1 unnamed protein product [Digitaria exilis]
MAAGKSSTPSPPTSFFKILKDGVLLPARNRSLFMVVFALAVAYTSLLLLINDLAIKPRANDVLRDVMAFRVTNGTEAITPDERDQLLQSLGKDTWRLVWASAAYLLLDVTVGNAVWIVALFAAVATFSGETSSCSFAALLGKARAQQLKGTVLTVAFVYGLQVAYFVLLLSAMAALLVHLFVKGPTGLLLLGFLLLFAAAVFLVYFVFLCALSVVVAVAEPERHGAGAVGRAWRLLRGRKRRAVLLVAMVGALNFACYRAHALARTRAVGSTALGMLLGFVYAVAVAGVELFAVCAMTAFYYECKESNDAATTKEFVKLASEEPLIGA